MFIHFCLFLSFRSKVCGIRSFFEGAIFSCEDVRESYRSGVHITSCHLVVLCVYIISSPGFTFLFILVHSLTFFEATFCTWCLWVYLLSQPSRLLCFLMLPSTKLTLLYLRVNLVHIGVTTHQLFIHQDSWWTLNLIQIFGNSWQKSHTTLCFLFFLSMTFIWIT